MTDPGVGQYEQLRTPHTFSFNEGGRLGSIDSGLYQFIFFWLVTAPVFTLLHEMGHALAALPFTTGPVIASIGNPNVPARELNAGTTANPFEAILDRFWQSRESWWRE